MANIDNILVNRNSSITLGYIFRRLVNNADFLCSGQEHVPCDESICNESQTGVMDVGKNSKRYLILAPGQVASCNKSMIPIGRQIIPGCHIRLGVPGSITDLGHGKDSGSLITSIAIMLRPELQGLPQAYIVEELKLLQDFIQRSILNNTQIDPIIKNSPQIRKQNIALAELMLSGHTSQDLFQRIANIFEVNILVCYLDIQNCTFYWAKGKIRPHLNILRRLWTFTCLDHHCEPVICKCKNKKEEHNNTDQPCTRDSYCKIIANDTLRLMSPITLGFSGMLHMQSGHIPADCVEACMKLFPRPTILTPNQLSKICMK